MKAIRKEIEKIERRMEWEQERLDKAVANFKESAASYDAYHIAEFLPSKIKEIAELRNRLQQLAEQKNMLEYLLGQQEV